MSELFKALQKLEEQQSSATLPKTPPLAGVSSRKSSPPYLRSILFCFFILLLAGASLLFVWYWKKPGSPFQSTHTPLATQTEKRGSITIQPVSIALETENVPGQAAARPEQSASDMPPPPPILPESGTAPEKGADSAGESVQQAQAAVEIKLEKQHKDLNIHESTVEENIVESSQKITLQENSKQITKEKQKKQILYRAEKYRAEANLQGTLRIYRQAWKISPDPDIANNMAAVYLQLQQYGKAEAILRQGLQMAPEDEDLRFNMKIALDGKKRTTRQ